MSFVVHFVLSGRVFVHEWAHLRWGVFDEYNTEKPFYLSAGQIQATRCTDKITGVAYEIVNGVLRQCQIAVNGLPTSDCEFYPHAMQKTNASIMFMLGIDSMTAFCHEGDHNYEAPNDQNSKCGKATRTVIFKDSVDAISLNTLNPLPSPPPVPTFRVIKRGLRVVCLVLDVSGSMQGMRIQLQKQAATVFLSQIINEKQFVGLVTFSTNAQILNSLTEIDGQAKRNLLINKLPTAASGSTYICKGLRKGFEVLRVDDGETTGDEIIFLTDGEATDNVQDCFQDAVQSGAIISTIALGPQADNVLRMMANVTGGIFRVAKDTISSNELVDAFSAMTIFDGNPTSQPIQLESTGGDFESWFNGTVTLDRTVGNRTMFTLIYERSAPSVYIKSPSGLVYDQRNTTDSANTITLTVPGTAEAGDWEYSFLNREMAAQEMSLTVMSRAAREDVYPVTVTTRIDQQSRDGSKPMIVLAEVSQNYNPVLGANVSATLESDKGHSVKLDLLDNGAGADAFKDDGIYSRYFTDFKLGKYSLKVRVENQNERVQFSPYRHNGALYAPGYIVDGKVELNPPKPPVNVQPVDVGSFTRTATGESFAVDVNAVTNFPPNKITDLIAEIQGDTVLLNWTAPGEDFDQGTADSYEIRWSEDLTMLRNNFNSAYLVNTSGLQPRASGSPEEYSFQPDIRIQNGTTLFFAIQSKDEQSAVSEVSNVARATKYVRGPRPPSISNEGLNLTAIIVSVCVVTIVACVITVIITCSLKRKNYG
ncbi:calcium-activated chloride channel regulator 4A-like [Clarias gariepinus]|uniref:calcium-activated chloride channel regulator 4A-like n=1 Tax=Clarias gariepinus TaxID=13013 RepID=UPI00234E1BF1|nr:calcium-activated chloride channel regulator 4A-like [Clarias gariepinus]